MSAQNFLVNDSPEAENIYLETPKNLPISEKDVIDNVDNIEKLLSMAEESEKQIFKLQQNLFVYNFSLVITTVIAVFVLVWQIVGKLFGDYNLAVLISSILIFLCLIIFFGFKIEADNRIYKKEKIAFETTLSVVQELLPYYLDRMSVLEQTIFKVRLSKLDIVVTETNEKQ